MCLSKVYIKEGDKDDLLIEDVSEVRNENGAISVNTIFGVGKKVKGYFIKEVNFVNNYLILRKEG